MEKNHSSTDLFCSILFYAGEIIKNTTFDSIYPTILKNNLSVKIDETISSLDKEKDIFCKIEKSCFSDVEKLIAILELLRDGYIGGTENEQKLLGKNMWSSDV